MIFPLDGAAPPHGLPFNEPKSHRVQCKKKELKDVHVPIAAGLFPRPEPAPKLKGSNKILEDTEDNLLEWDTRIQALFEWIGMASLGAQRYDFAPVLIQRYTQA